MDSIDTLFNTIDSTKITTTQDSDKICDTESVTDKELVNDKSIIKCNVNTLNSYHIKIKSISESELQGLSKNQRKKILKKIHWNSIKLEKRYAHNYYHNNYDKIMIILIYVIFIIVEYPKD